MKPASLALTLATLLLATSAGAADYRLDDLYGPWCLKGMSLTQDGEREPDNSTYDFTRAGTLDYSMGGFTQSGAYRVEGDTISTEVMGNYKIVSIGKQEMVLHYMGYFFYQRGACE
ncbi:hypothetical protein [Pseudomonas sp. PDM13]|uniref:hypothetical protein n=1 Tax=Pseudomonas sp. PDM13 TaxID=2769255 RepID=UPI0021E0C863|nr:hypothetical protein [Pseudomonas sp. PDM13]MCU9948454.1 hypothetical protein [Pseudomonas sp. PDM13]